MTELNQDYKLLKFALGAMTAAVPLAYAREVLPMAELIRPPRLVLTVEGLLNLGGVTYPVLRLDRLLGLDDFTPSLDTHLILTRGLQLTCLLMVDRVLGVEAIAAAELQPIPEYVTSGAGARTQYQTSAGAVHVLDLDQLLAAPARALKVVA